MTEKADLSTDTVSLPPTYAPSESFTESPPPAYRKPGMAAVRVARIVCCTLLAMTFMVGFFVVMHKWVQNRECKCAMDEAGSVRHAALFAQAPNQLNSDLNNNQIEEAISKTGPEPSMVNEQSAESEEEVAPEEQIIDDERSEEEAKDVNLPKDLLLGNPKLAGRNVHCKVEKRQRKIAEGIMTQAIIVTCDDEDDEEGSSDEENEDKPLLNIVPLRPPMSLLSNIMKVLSSRPRSMERDRDEPPRMIPFPFRSPPPQGPVPMRRPFPGPFQGPISPIFVPLRKIEMNRPPTESEEGNVPVPFLRGPPPPFMNEERPPPMQHRPMPPPPMRFLQRPDETNERRGPFPFPSGPVPIRIIRLPHRENELNNEEENQDVFPQEEENEGPMPLPIHPFIKLLPARRRIIRLRPKQSFDNAQSLENALPFPFPRGALPPRFPEEQPVPHPMPEATGRALPAPVALPGVRVLRLPFRPQPLPFSDAKLITHMEVREPTEEEEKPQELQEDSFQPPNLLENKGFRLNNKEFGPPKIHTVLENLPLPIFPQEEQQPEEESPALDTIHHEPITQTQSQPRVLAPPPPRFAREGRTSILAQLNPDAEVIRNIEETDRPRPAMHQVVLN